MKSVLRNRPTRLYVQAAGEWTDQAAAALAFPSMGKAIQFARAAGLRQMELVLCERSGALTAVEMEAVGYSQRLAQ
jgi:hypothetical protein